MKKNRSSKSEESGRQSQLSNEESSFISRIFGGGQVDGFTAHNDVKSAKKRSPRYASWSEFVPLYMSIKEDELTPSKILEVLRDGISRRFSTYTGFSKRYGYQVLQNAREKLCERFPNENPLVLALEYVRWYLSERADSDMARRGKWFITHLGYDRNIVAFCEQYKNQFSNNTVSAPQNDFSRLPLDEDTLKKRLRHPLPAFVADYGPVVPFIVLQKMENLLPFHAQCLVVEATKNLVRSGASTYDSISDLIASYGPYPNAFAEMGVTEMVQSLSLECSFAFDDYLKFSSSND
jgi:hypothetical protein